jgi:hypothetical protein
MSPLSLHIASQNSAVSIQRTISHPICDNIFLMLVIETAPPARLIRPTRTFEFDDTAKPSLSVSDKQRLSVRRKRDTTRRAKEVEDLF